MPFLTLLLENWPDEDVEDWPDGRILSLNMVPMLETTGIDEVTGETSQALNSEQVTLLCQNTWTLNINNGIDRKFKTWDEVETQGLSHCLSYLH